MEAEGLGSCGEVAVVVMGTEVVYRCGSVAMVLAVVMVGYNERGEMSCSDDLHRER